MDEVTAIYVAYNSEGVIIRSLQSIDCGRVIVIDNCSSDDTIEIVKTHFPQAEIIENPRNEGFGRANNQGLALIKTPYALLINPDAVLQAACLEALVKAAKDYPDAAIIAPQLVGKANERHVSYKQNVFLRERHSQSDAELPSGDLSAEFLSGAVWLVNMEHLTKVGFFDPAIFLYYEDDDLCLRVRKCGFGLVLAHDAKAVHVMGTSSGIPNFKSDYFKQMHMSWSRLYLERKYRGEKAAKRLSTWRHFILSMCWSYHMLTFNKRKINRYRGKIAGIMAFERSPGRAPN